MKITLKLSHFKVLLLQVWVRAHIMWKGKGKAFPFQCSTNLMQPCAARPWEWGNPSLEWGGILGSKFRGSSVRQTGRWASGEEAQVVSPNTKFSGRDLIAPLKLPMQEHRTPDSFLPSTSLYLLVFVFLQSTLLTVLCICLLSVSPTRRLVAESWDCSIPT